MAVVRVGPPVHEEPPVEIGDLTEGRERVASEAQDYILDEVAR